LANNNGVGCAKFDRRVGLVDDSTSTTSTTRTATAATTTWYVQVSGTDVKADMS
jgi:hypothetical protein